MIRKKSKRLMFLFLVLMGAVSIVVLTTVMSGCQFLPDTDAISRTEYNALGLGNVYTCHQQQHGYSYKKNIVEDRTIGVYNFTLNSRHRCWWKNHSELRVAIVILSKHSNFHQRYTIRQTWANCDKCDTSVGIVFLLGKADDKSKQTLIDRESAIFNDVVQVDLAESYETLTYKSMAMLEWFYRYCNDADVYIKADDDIYMNINNVEEAVLTYSATYFFSSYVIRRSRPRRNPKSKSYVSKNEYGGNFYPPYCSGPAYIFSANLLTGLYKASLVTPIMPVEDVYISGILVTKLNVSVQHIHSLEFMHNWNNAIDCKLKKSYSVHHVEIQDILNIYTFLQQNKC